MKCFKRLLHSCVSRIHLETFGGSHVAKTPGHRWGAVGVGVRCCCEPGPWEAAADTLSTGDFLVGLVGLITPCPLGENSGPGNACRGLQFASRYALGPL